MFVYVCKFTRQLDTKQKASVNVTHTVYLHLVYWDCCEKSKGEIYKCNSDSQWEFFLLAIQQMSSLRFLLTCNGWWTARKLNMTNVAPTTTRMN